MSQVEFAFFTSPVAGEIAPGIPTPTVPRRRSPPRVAHEAGHGPDRRRVVLAGRRDPPAVELRAAVVERDPLDLRAAEVQSDAHARGFFSVPPADFKAIARSRGRDPRGRGRGVRGASIPIVMGGQKWSELESGNEALLDLRGRGRGDPRVPRARHAPRLGELRLPAVHPAPGPAAKVMHEQPTPNASPGASPTRGRCSSPWPATRDEVEREASGRGGKKAAEIREKGARNAETRVYQTGDMLYFIYFDADGVMRDFTA